MGCSSSLSLDGSFEKPKLMFKDSMKRDEAKNSPNNNNCNNKNSNNSLEKPKTKTALDKSKCVHNDLSFYANLRKSKVAPETKKVHQNGFKEQELKKAPLLIVSPNHSPCDTDTANIVPYIQDYSPSSNYNHSSLSHNQTVTDFKHSQEQKEEIHRQIKSALKSGRSRERSRMIADRPIKSVTFVDSVTVVTVF